MLLVIVVVVVVVVVAGAVVPSATAAATRLAWDRRLVGNTAARKGVAVSDKTRDMRGALEMVRKGDVKAAVDALLFVVLESVVVVVAAAVAPPPAAASASFQVEE